MPMMKKIDKWIKEKNRWMTTLYIEEHPLYVNLRAYQWYDATIYFQNIFFYRICQHVNDMRKAVDQDTNLECYILDSK